MFLWPFWWPNIGSEFYIDLSEISTCSNVAEWQKYVRRFAKSEKSWVSNFTRFMIKFGSHFGMVFPWFYHKVSILFLHWFSEPFFLILSDFWWKVEPKRFPKSDQNLPRIRRFAPRHHLGRPWHVLVLIWCPFDAFWMTLVFVFPASVFRLFTHQTRHLVLSFNMENDQHIKAHLLRWFPAIL